VESSCELGNEPSGSIKCSELPRGCTSCGLSSGTQLHRVSYVRNFELHGYNVEIGMYIRQTVQNLELIGEFFQCFIVNMPRQMEAYLK
jgi:hypothetical protein